MHIRSVATFAVTNSPERQSVEPSGESWRERQKTARLCATCIVSRTNCTCARTNFLIQKKELQDNRHWRDPTSQPLSSYRASLLAASTVRFRTIATQCTAVHCTYRAIFSCSHGALLAVNLTVWVGWQNCSCIDGVSKMSERGKRRPKWQCDVITMHEGDELVAGEIRTGRKGGQMGRKRKAKLASWTCGCGDLAQAIFVALRCTFRPQSSFRGR